MKTENLSHNRVLFLDFLKFVGLFCILLAHVKPPECLFMLRNFDVPLMVIISAMLGQMTFQKYKAGNTGKLSFYINRAKRLIYPTWIFLCVYFVLQAIIGNVYSGTYYLYSFLLTEYGVGYVWIILVYLYSALLIPLCDNVSAKKQSWIYVGLIYLVYELICYFGIGANSKLINSTVYYIVPYGLLTYLGFNYRRFSKKTKMSIIVVAALVFGALGIFYWNKYGSFQNVQIVKYPPKAYYLSYGIMVSFIALSVCEKIQLTKLYTNKFITFTAQHSMWIYLWHIIVLRLYGFLGLADIWYIKFVFVYLVSSLTVICVNKFLDITGIDKKYGFFRYLRG